MVWHHDWHHGWHHNWHGLAPSDVLPGTGPEGVGTFVVELQNGYTVNLRWVTDVIKTRSGKEQRISRNDRSLDRYEGKALLLGTHAAEIRTQLAEHAAKGMPFRLGLPHEELTLRADSVGTTVYVTTTAKSDWMNPGQRVLVKRNGQGVDAIVQSTTADSITLDIEPGGLGARGGSIMPTVPILLDPEQAFPRYRTGAELWDLRATAMSFDFARKLASVSLGSYTSHAGLANASVTERHPGTVDSFRMTGYGLDGEGALDESTSDVWFEFAASGFQITTIDDLYNALTASAKLAPTGTWVLDGSDLTLGDEMDQPLTGGETAGPVGTGATITEYDGRPLWHERIKNASTITDSIQSHAQIIDHNGVPYALGWADMADWGRTVAFQGKGLDDWQWLKLFIATVKGRQKSFWLSTWRDDLPFVSKSTNTITVSGNVGVWWPLQRQHVQVWETDGTLTRAEVTAATDNGDGTWTLTIGTTLATSSVRMVSWLELCRFTSDDFGVTFGQSGFWISTVATVVQEGAPYAGSTYIEDEASTEDSEPRELFTISINDGVTVYRHTSASRDISYGGEIYTAIAMDRSPIAMANHDEEEETAILLPIDHDLAKRWPAQASPPFKAEVTIMRLQANSEGTETIWQGEIHSMSPEKGIARFRVPSTIGQWMLRPIPSFGITGSCVHSLGDSNCRVSFADSSPGGAPHKITATVLAVNGRNVRAQLGSGTAHNGSWAVDGKLVHTASGEPRAVVRQTDENPGVNGIATLLMNLAIPGMKAGDSVDIYAGCPKTMKACNESFDNRQNHLGWHLRPGADYFSPVFEGVRK